MCDNIVKPLYYEWSKSYKAHNADYFQSHRYLNVKKFVPSYDAPCAPMANMYCLLAWQYAPIWRCEVNKFLAKRNKLEGVVFIKPDVNFNRNRYNRKRSKKSKRSKKQ